MVTLPSRSFNSRSNLFFENGVRRELVRITWHKQRMSPSGKQTPKKWRQKSVDRPRDRESGVSPMIWKTILDGETREGTEGLRERKIKTEGAIKSFSFSPLSFPSPSTQLAYCLRSPGLYPRKEKKETREKNRKFGFASPETSFFEVAETERGGERGKNKVQKMGRRPSSKTNCRSPFLFYLAYC